MEDVTKKLLQANVVTYALIQEVFISAKKLQSIDDNRNKWDKISQILWHHLQIGLPKLDDQLLCSTCLYTVITLTGREEFYVAEVLQVIQNEINQRSNDVMINPKTTWAVSLMYGMFQSNFLAKSNSENATTAVLLKLMNELLIQMAYDYSRNTFTVFKTISSFKKVCGTQLQDCIFTKSNQVRLLNLVNHNWENPITGVRDLNKTIFQTLISLMDDVTYQKLVKEINSFYWNKAKYLMLAEMIGQYNGNVLNLIKESDWLAGLTSSLEKPGLVSAGTDMYFAILKKLANEDDWIRMFSPTIERIINGENTKAIEHFNNYWCLQTFKKYPSLINQFETIFENIDDLERKLYTGLIILKQANKLGLVQKNWSPITDHKMIEYMLLQGIKHGNVDIRMAAFDIICEFQGKTIPSQMEFELALNYIKNNINSDCTVLRLGMLKSLKNFLMQNHAAFTTHCKNGDPVDLKYLRQFLIDLQDLIISNLNVRGNYQRKITSVKVCSIMWECLIDIPKNKKNQMRHSDITLYKMLVDDGNWLLSDNMFIKKLITFLEDPSDDIRENVVHLLLNNYSTAFKKTDFINYVIEGALKSIRGKFFYEISCGQSMFKLIVSILLKERLELATFKTVEDIFSFSFNELIQEHDLKRDILESIENGKQLHSFMDIMLVVLDICDQKSYNINISDDEITRLLKTLDSISNHFAWEDNSSSSDFSKMNDMVEQIINKSGHTSKDDKDSTKISGIHQMVLNCMWLNVKACCDLASLMIRHCHQVEHIEKFLLIITRVLESSRHKGAIEAAGAALGQSIQYLTSLPDETDISSIPHVLLKSKLKELISEASKMASITRRGAGLSIMVHRIVSSDMKKGKPLFHYFMSMILETCSHSEDLPEKQHGNPDIDNEKDLPKAIYIHFLTRIVVDSSIASDVMYYSPQLAKLAFDNLTSPHWQIRNAALQLYGALVPKLIGQKKASGSGDETIATVACDEIRTHSPKLWTYINFQLSNSSTADKVLSHSNLVPILNMMANSAMRYNLSSDTTEAVSSHAILLKSLIGLLDSPIYTVRRLAAKSIFNIFSFESIYETLMEDEIVSENFLHGVLMLLTHIYKYYSKEKNIELNILGQAIQTKLSDGRHSYLCKEMFEDIFGINVTIDMLQTTMKELDSNIYTPGIHAWANTRVRKCIESISWNDIPNVLEIFMNRNNFNYCCKMLFEKMQCQKGEIPKDVLIKIAELLSACNNKFDSSEIWKILYKISQLVELKVCTESLLHAVRAHGCSYKLRYLLPFITWILSSKHEEKSLEYLSTVILGLCDPETTDVELRYIAALANNELSNTFHTLTDTVKVTTIKCAIILLQDEDEDVRKLSTIFCKNISHLLIIPHPYISLKELMNPKTLKKIFLNPKTGIQMLRQDLIELLAKTNKVTTGVNYNPFACDSKNIYFEVDILQQLVDDLNVC